ncbi:UNVERIFIED_CONTAM: hypothetical protein GTU68_034483 [Idotea baltica]|nr:hypothetical protein [Idotea baltica]
MFRLEIILFLLVICRSENTEPQTGGLDSLFQEIGFSPACVSQALSRCENSKISSYFQEIKTQIKSLHKSIEVQKRAETHPRNCADLLNLGDKESGVRTVYPFSWCENRPVTVLCDQTTDGGGWTVIQHREDVPQREDFFRNWVEYELGFGNVTKEFWLGLENIHALGNNRWAKYKYFHLGNAAEKYKLDIGAYSGDAGDSLIQQKRSKFSTRDQDNDIYPGNCAQQFKGAWWYDKCHISNLNGYQYEGKHDSYADGIYWKTFHSDNYSLKETSLLVRPASLG